MKDLHEQLTKVKSEVVNRINNNNNNHNNHNNNNNNTNKQQMVPGPVEVRLPDGTTIKSDLFIGVFGEFERKSGEREDVGTGSTIGVGVHGNFTMMDLILMFEAFIAIVEKQMDFFK